MSSERGQIERFGRGLFRRPGAPLSECRPGGGRPARPGRSCLRLVYLSGSALCNAVEEHVDGTVVRVFGAAKTVVDCFKFRNKIGTDGAVEALREYRRAHRKRLDAVWRAAEVDRVTQVMRPCWEAMG
jgi:hypothetical protein